MHPGKCLPRVTSLDKEKASYGTELPSPMPYTPFFIKVERGTTGSPPLAEDSLLLVNILTLYL